MELFAFRIILLILDFIKSSVTVYGSGPCGLVMSNTIRINIPSRNLINYIELNNNSPITRAFFLLAFPLGTVIGITVGIIMFIVTALLVAILVLSFKYIRTKHYRELKEIEEEEKVEKKLKSTNNELVSSM